MTLNLNALSSCCCWLGFLVQETVKRALLQQSSSSTWYFGQRSTSHMPNGLGGFLSDISYKIPIPCTTVLEKRKCSGLTHSIDTLNIHRCCRPERCPAFAPSSTRVIRNLTEREHAVSFLGWKLAISGFLPTPALHGACAGAATEGHARHLACDLE